jgi:biotin-(acetyl-CoA carboxylase) ligase
MPFSARALDLPPPFRPLALREVGDAFSHATAEAGALGAGTLVFVGRFDLAEFAVVLEPEETLAGARCAFYAGMTALADTLAALAPPETSIAIDWPDAVRIGRGLIGGGRLGWPRGTSEDAIPDWLVFGAMVRLASMTGKEALHPLATALEDEGFGALGAERFVESFARHLMAAFERWRDGDFAGLAREYAAKLPRERGVIQTIDANGDLRIERLARPVVRLDLRSALALPSWLDPATGGPRS